MKQWLILCSKLLYKIGQSFLDILYYPPSQCDTNVTTSQCRTNINGMICTLPNESSDSIVPILYLNIHPYICTKYENNPIKNNSHFLQNPKIGKSYIFSLLTPNFLDDLCTKYTMSISYIDTNILVTSYPKHAQNCETLLPCLLYTIWPHEKMLYVWKSDVFVLYNCIHC